MDDLHQGVLVPAIEFSRGHFRHMAPAGRVADDSEGLVVPGTTASLSETTAEKPFIQLI
jgi:hypothetical protein